MVDNKDKEVKKPDDSKPETKRQDELSDADVERVSGGSSECGTECLPIFKRWGYKMTPALRAFLPPTVLS
jgi:hypothetical protein